MSETQAEKWLNKMILKYGSEELVRAEMSRRQKKSREHPNNAKGTSKGGFACLDPEKHKELSSKGGRISRRAKKVV